MIQDIIDALPAAAEQLSNLLTFLFTSQIAIIVVPFLLIDLIALVLLVFRGRDDA